MLTYLLWAFTARLAPRVPQRLQAVLGAAGGTLAYLLNRRARAAALRNLAVICPDLTERERRRLAIRTFVHGAWSYLELFVLAHTGPDKLRAAYRIVGWEHLDAALADGRGVIMVTAHVGAPSVTGQLVALHGVQANVVVEPMRPAALHRLINHLRGAFGIRTLPIDASTVRHIVAALRRNEVVGILADRDVAGSGEILPFFGRPTRVTTAAATLARRTGASVVPAIAFRTGAFHGVGRIEPAVEIPTTSSPAGDARAGTLRILERIERFVREHPEQWVMFSDIWPEDVEKRAEDTQRSSTIRGASGPGA